TEQSVVLVSKLVRTFTATWVTVPEGINAVIRIRAIIWIWKPACEPLLSPFRIQRQPVGVQFLNHQIESFQRRRADGDGTTLRSNFHSSIHKNSLAIKAVFDGEDTPGSNSYSINSISTLTYHSPGALPGIEGGVWETAI